MAPRFAARCGAVLGLLLPALVAARPATAVSAAERGLPLIRSYVPNLGEAATENFAVAQDSRGLLYVGNLAGLLVYDGAWWRIIEVAGGTAALSVASDGRGRVAVGGVDDFGTLAADESGSLRFVSLLPLVPPERRELGDVVGIHPLGDGFAFLAERRLLVWDGSSLTEVAEFPLDGPLPASFRVGADVYLWTAEGLFRLRDAALEPLPGGEAFRDRRIDLLLPAGPGRALAAVRGEGLFRLDFGTGEALPFAPEASHWAAAHHALAGARLPDGRWAVGSQLGGLLLLSPAGTVERVIDTAVGLPDDFVSGVVLDREGSLWLSLNNGLARVEVGSRLSVLDGRSGLKGAVYHLARHGGHLWTAGSAGVFTTAGAGGSGAPTLAPVAGVPASAWSLVSVGEELLVGTSRGVWGIAGAGARPVAGTAEITAYVLSRSHADPRRLWVGMRDGLGAVRREPSGWRWEGRVEGVPRYVRSVVERGEVVWCGTTFDGLVRVAVPPGGPFAMPPAVAVEGPASETSLFLVGDRVLATRGEALLTLDEAAGRLVADPALAGLGGHGPVFQLAGDAEGNLWMNTRPLGVALRRGDAWAPELRALVAIPARDVQGIVAEPDGVVWLAGENGLYRHAGSSRGDPEPPPAPLLSRISLGDGSLLWGGAPGVAPRPATLPADARRLRIELAPASFQAGLRFQTRLLPIDPEWSRPSAEPVLELARLPPGKYTFRARTLDPGGEAGPETAWSFRVPPPWYATGWAVGLWVLSVAAAVVGYGRWRSRALRREAARLEARVAAQTVELVRAVDDLRRAQADVEEKNRLLEAANRRLEELSLADELTGIPNRRHLAQALAEEWSRARRHRQPIAFVLLDLDHFKSLNDSRGHRQGDLALQAVSGYLASEVRRPGDLVARWGGEEFALLLPGTDLEGARHLAEHLRAGIEALALAHQASPDGRLTASFGVAAWVPSAAAGQGEDGAGAEALVQAADAALYRAKTEGRNRVRAAG